MHVIICEDESYYQEAICNAIDEWKTKSERPDVCYTTFQSSENFLAHWEKGLPVDLLLLDIQIPGELNGMEVAKRIRQRDGNILIAFITNYINYVFDGYIVDALRYMKKPVKKEDIFSCMDIAYHRFMLLSKNTIAVETKGITLALRFSEIICVEMQSHYLHLFLSTNKEVPQVRARLIDFAQRLPSELFIQCHRSYIVNLEHVRRFSGTGLTMSNASVVPVSKPYVAKLKTAFNAYFSGELPQEQGKSAREMSE